MKSRSALKRQVFVLILTLCLLVIAPGLFPNTLAQFGPCFEAHAGATEPVFRGTASVSLPYTYDPNYHPNLYRLDFDPAALAWGFQDVNWSGAPGSLIQVSIPAGAPAGTYQGRLTLREERPVGQPKCDSNESPFSITIVACPVPPTSLITVNSLGDTADANLADGVCNDGTGKCTLRAAITQANSLSICSQQQINFSVNGTITLGSPLPNLTQSLAILGPGARQLTVQSSLNFRIFNIPNQGLSNVISGLTISNSRGIFSASNLTLTDCAITGNQAPFDTDGEGAGICLKNADGVFTGCTISGNTAAFKGGGIYYQGDGGHKLRLTNCTISGNTVNNPFNSNIFGGGGLFHVSNSGSSTLEVTNCTIADNVTVATKGGGIATSSNGAGNVATTTLRNTIIAGNPAPNLAIIGASVTSSLGNNLTDDNGGGFLNQATDKINTNPLLGPLTDNGGPTQTQTLLLGSLALDAGNNCVTQAPTCLPAPITTDQRGTGFARKFGSAVDIGALEARVGVPTRLSFGVQPTSTTPNTIISPSVTVRVLDDTNAFIPSSSATINLALGNNPSGASLGGTTNVAAAGGIATFNNLSVNLAGVGYTLAASSSGLVSAASNAFDICPVITVTLGTVPPIFQRATSTPLPYTATGGASQYSIDYDDAANATGFQDVMNAVLPASPIVLALPGAAAVGTYHGTLTLRASGSGCLSNSTPFTVTLLPCSAVAPPSFTVNSLGDTSDANLSDGLCNDGTGKCTLRAAIEQTNALGACAPLQIIFSVNGTITLGSALPNITQSLALLGPGARQ
jgi:CSLREA domain-containing protein